MSSATAVARASGVAAALSRASPPQAQGPGRSCRPVLSRSPTWPSTRAFGRGLLGQGGLSDRLLGGRLGQRRLAGELIGGLNDRSGLVGRGLLGLVCLLGLLDQAGLLGDGLLGRGELWPGPGSAPASAGAIAFWNGASCLAN